MGEYKCSIIADPKGNAWDFAKEVHRLLVEMGGKKYELNEENVKRFRDGEIKPRIKDNLRRKNCFFIHDSTKKPADWFLELALMLETMQNSSAQEITAVLPYLRFSRQDRKDESRVPISTQVVAGMIEKYADRVLTLDVHNPAIQNAYHIPLDNLYSFATAVTYLKEKHPEFLENLVVMSPDAGGVDRAEAFAKRVGTERAVYGSKRRKESGEVKNLEIVGDVTGCNVLVVDDIIDSGGTLVRASAAARERGAKRVGAYAAHGIFTEGIDKITKCLDLVVVGDSVVLPEVRKSGKIEVISFAKLFAEAISRISEGESLSELFD